jgi:hypothetical protein
MVRQPARCEWTSLDDALKAFVLCEAGYQSARHIRPLHWYVASRLVIEGGFRPDDITPRPPFTIRPQNRRLILDMMPSRVGPVNGRSWAA